jgi:hypothetical protein
VAFFMAGHSVEWNFFGEGLWRHLSGACVETSFADERSGGLLVFLRVAGQALECRA